MLDYQNQGKNEHHDYDKHNDKHCNAKPLKEGAHGG